MSEEKIALKPRLIVLLPLLYIVLQRPMRKFIIILHEERVADMMSEMTSETVGNAMLSTILVLHKVIPNFSNYPSSYTLLHPPMHLFHHKTTLFVYVTFIFVYQWWLGMPLLAKLYR